MNKLFEETERIIKDFRSVIQGHTETAKAIDREDCWGDIAEYAMDEGYNTFADVLIEADLEWE